MIFDKTNQSLTFLNSGYGIATGSFSIGAPIVFTNYGISSGQSRLRNSEFYQVSKYHLIYGQPDNIKYSTLNNIIDPSNEGFWSGSMQNDYINIV